MVYFMCLSNMFFRREKSFATSLLNCMCLFFLLVFHVSKMFLFGIFLFFWDKMSFELKHTRQRKMNSENSPLLMCSIFTLHKQAEPHLVVQPWCHQRSLGIAFTCWVANLFLFIFGFLFLFFVKVEILFENFFPSPLSSTLFLKNNPVTPNAFLLVLLLKKPTSF